MQFLNNIPTDYTLTSFFKPFYELYSVKALPTTLTVDRAFGRVLNIVNEKAKQPLLAITPDNFRETCKSVFGRLSEGGGNKAFIAFSGGQGLSCDSHQSGGGGLQPHARLCRRSEQKSAV